MEYLFCTKCQQFTVVELETHPGYIIGSCIYCDLPSEDDDFNIYLNHCWNCGFGIDSRFSIPSIIPGMAYHCGYCGKDLSEWKLRKGLITATELNNLRLRYLFGVPAVGFQERIILEPVTAR